MREILKIFKYIKKRKDLRELPLIPTYTLFSRGSDEF